MGALDFASAGSVTAAGSPPIVIEARNLREPRRNGEPDVGALQPDVPKIAIAQRIKSPPSSTGAVFVDVLPKERCDARATRSPRAVEHG